MVIFGDVGEQKMLQLTAELIEGALLEVALQFLVGLEEVELFVIKLLVEDVLLQFLALFGGPFQRPQVVEGKLLDHHLEVLVYLLQVVQHGLLFGRKKSVQNLPQLQSVYVEDVQDFIEDFVWVYVLGDVYLENESFQALLQLSQFQQDLA